VNEGLFMKRNGNGTHIAAVKKQWNKRDGINKRGADIKAGKDFIRRGNVTGALQYTWNTEVRLCDSRWIVKWFDRVRRT
jgi:hypothetical protein